MGRNVAWRRDTLRARRARFLLPLLVILAVEVHGAEYPQALPLGLQEQAAYIPEDNPLTPEKIALGKQFFWDTRWSRNGTVACVSCHDPNHGWGDPRQFSVRFDGKPTPRHSPTLINRLFSDRQQWAGTRASLEDQAFKASDQSPELLVSNLGAIAAYQEQFRNIFGTDLNAEGVAKAIAAYERTILSGNSAYDRFLAGEPGALSPAAQRGLVMFEGKARCVTCHAGFNFTDQVSADIGDGHVLELDVLEANSLCVLDRLVVLAFGEFDTDALRTGHRHGHAGDVGAATCAQFQDSAIVERGRRHAKHCGDSRQSVRVRLRERIIRIRDLIVAVVRNCGGRSS